MINTENELAIANRKIQLLLEHCPEAECMECGKIICPFEEPLHFHHDGCPACYSHEQYDRSKQPTKNTDP